MSATVERKVLRLNNPKQPGMWQAPKEIVQNKLSEELKKSVATELKQYIEKLPSSPTYNESFRYNAAVKEKILALISQAYKELTNSLRFKNRADEAFALVAKEVREYVENEIGADNARKFNDVYEEFMHPKQAPKVFLSAPGN
jgi:sugar-specific transcriptional regulator TrmB